MSNPLSAMLDELMGKHRNAMPTDETKETTWEDSEICPYFLAGYCPHEMFTNTRADLGLCYRIHDENLREQYRKSDRFEKAGLEDEFLEYLQRVQNDMQRKIDRNKQRLDITQPGGEVKDASKDNIIEKVTQLSEKITALLSQAEQLGEKGQVEEAQGVVKMMEELKEERDRLQQNLDVPTSELRSMEVCDICGCFLIMGDAQHRLDEHFTGKQHIGFAKIKVTVDELLRRKHEKREQRDKELKQLRDKEDEERRKRRSERNRSKNRSRSRDRNHNSSASSRRDKRSRSHSRHRKNGDEKRRKSSGDHRRRSKSRERKSHRKAENKIEEKKDEKSRSHRHRNGTHEDKEKNGSRRSDETSRKSKDYTERRHKEHSTRSKQEIDEKSRGKDNKRRTDSIENPSGDAEKKRTMEKMEAETARDPSPCRQSPPLTPQVTDSASCDAARISADVDNGPMVDAQ